jgi:hypothetical protein
MALVEQNQSDMSCSLDNPEGCEACGSRVLRWENIVEVTANRSMLPALEQKIIHLFIANATPHGVAFC